MKDARGAVCCVHERPLLPVLVLPLELHQLAEATFIQIYDASSIILFADVDVAAIVQQSPSVNAVKQTTKVVAPLSVQHVITTESLVLEPN